LYLQLVKFGVYGSSPTVTRKLSVCVFVRRFNGIDVLSNHGLDAKILRK
jgi:hypothetical protein